MPCAIIIHGEIGAGKTRTALALAERARSMGLRVRGVLSVRVLDDGFIGYDALDTGTGETFPLVRLREEAEGEDWDHHGNPRFAFSASGLKRANRVLACAAEEMDDETLVFVDEYGRLEARGLGIHRGARRVAEALRDGGVGVFLCRADRVEDVRALMGDGAEFITVTAGNVDAAWRIVTGCLHRQT